MANKYHYGWDAVNKKKVYLGKFPEANPRGQGYFKNDEAGNRLDFTSKDWGVDRGFVGSESEEYTFSNPKRGTHTITAESYQEALRIAESMGYTRGDYKKRRGRK